MKLGSVYDHYDKMILALDGVRQEPSDNDGLLSVYRTNRLLALTNTFREISKKHKNNKRSQKTMNGLLDDIPIVKSS